MAYCANCGSQIPEGNDKCPACGAPVVNVLTPAGGGNNQNQGGYGPGGGGYGRDGGGFGPAPGGRRGGRGGNYAFSPRPSMVNANLEMAEGEKLVRQYQCADIKMPRCQGFLKVTNKRIVFQAQSANSRIEKEVSLESVSGLDCYYGLNINVGLMAMALVMFFAAIFMFTSPYGRYMSGYGVIFLLGAVAAGFFAVRKAFMLSIFSTAANGSPISIGQGAKTLAGNGAVFALASKPTMETDRMLNEIGALVHDLQAMGDHAVEKWENK